MTTAALVPTASGERPDWWASCVTYEIYLRSFKDSDGDGIGDLQGVIDTLDYLSATLGVEAVWLTPFYPTPMVDGGYDISDFCDVDPRFGSLADFDRLVAAAHSLGLRLIIDFVPNHTSSEHPWFVASRSSRDSELRDWYVWRPPAASGGPPNNWTSEMGGSSWAFDAATGEYYLHSFFAEQPDLDWRNDDVRAAMLGVVDFWMARGVDGLRVDVAHLIAKDPAFRDNPPKTPVPNPTDRQHPDFDTQAHVHDRLHPDVHHYLGEVRDRLDEWSARTGRSRAAVAEIEVLPWDDWARFHRGAQVAFNFALIECPWRPDALAELIRATEAAVPPGSAPNYVLQNHDRPRLASRLGPHVIRQAAVLLLTMRGSATLYYGEELGLPDLELPPATWQDQLGRDQGRAPMPWSSGEHSGFTSGTPWTSEYADPKLTIDSQLADPRSTLSLYRRLLALRRAVPALRRGDVHLIDDAPDWMLAYRRVLDGQSVLVVLSFAESEERVALDAPGVLLATTDQPDPPRSHVTEVVVPAHGAVVVDQSEESQR